MQKSYTPLLWKINKCLKYIKMENNYFTAKVMYTIFMFLFIYLFIGVFADKHSIYEEKN